MKVQQISAAHILRDDIQMRQGHWAVVDLIGEGGHIRTVPIPNWVKTALDQWTRAANVTEGKIFRAVACGQTSANAARKFSSQKFRGRHYLGSPLGRLQAGSTTQS